MHRFALAAFVVSLAPLAVCASEGEAVSYNRDIRPILSNACFKCHGPDQKRGGLDLQSHATATAEMKSGDRAITPGNSAESELLRRVMLAHDDDARMPPAGKSLTAVQVAKLKAWIDAGAKYEEHWAYVTPTRPTAPESKWGNGAIDKFVYGRLKREKLEPSPEAPRTTLLRRVSLDLTGLPPTLAELDAFEKDSSPTAYEKAVDRLLASSAYGEHMARWWLDLARYADTNGYEADARRNMYPYRDWVIDAFASGMPFDQFTVKQIAGDLLPGSTVNDQTATGFHRNTMTNTEGGTDDEEFRVAAVVDRVNTTMEVWMGSTFACVQCHNHKYDPFTQREYFQLYAFFNNTADAGRSVAPELTVYSPEQERERELLSRQQVRAGLGMFATPTASVRLAELQKAHADIKGRTSLVMRELPKPRPSFVHVRGNHTSKGDIVLPGVPAKLHPLPNPPGQAANRLDLAKWLVDTRNPLVGRVTMNRIWARLFGKGLVETSEDFGLQGEPPSHPELLDWLAAEFATTWDLKHMQRLIVTSATYRQSSRVSKQLAERDPFNRLLARGSRTRLEAETIRDNALTIAGLLDRKVGGPSVFPHQPDGIWANPYSGDRWTLSAGTDRYRRGLYTFWRRTAPYAGFMTFDAPSREVACERRPRSNTPLQALTTLNDQAFIECAGGLAQRLVAEGGPTPRDRVRHAMRLCVSREPSERETELLTKLHADTLARYRDSVKDAQSLVLSAIPTGTPQGADVADLAAWVTVANVMLNLDETITRN